MALRRVARLPSVRAGPLEQPTSPIFAAVAPAGLRRLKKETNRNAAGKGYLGGGTGPVVR